MKNADKKTIPQAVLDNEKNKSSLVRNLQRLTVGELIELYAYSQAIVETVREPLVILDKELKVKTANKSFYDTFRVSKKDTQGKFIYELGNRQWDIPELRELLEKILIRSQFVQDFEVNHNFEQIGQKTMLLNARRIILEGHKTHLILLAIEDITERKTLEQQREDFLNMASHELKTPITSIKFFSQIIQKRMIGIGDEKVKYLLANIMRQSDKLNELLNELLQVGKVDSGKFAVVREKTNLEELIKKIVTDFQFISKKHSIEIHGSVKQKVLADPERIEQVLMNLLSNAIKYSPQADRVIVEVKKNKSRALVSVQDFGIGISKNSLPKVFEKYYRTSENSHKAKGFGLGLYISSEIIKRHGGEIWVESKKGKGSTFYFTVPFK